MKTNIIFLAPLVIVVAMLMSCSDMENKSGESLAPAETIYQGTKVGDDARSETVVKQSTEDREWWGNVNNAEIADAVFEAVYSGKKTPYDFLGNKLTVEDVKKMESSVDTMYIENIETGQLEMKIIENKLKREDIVKFFFKENWYFDKETLKFAKEIKAITLLTEKYNEKGDMLGHSPLFTVYFDKKYEPSDSSNVSAKR